MTPTEQARLKPRTTRRAGVNENKGGSSTSTPPPKQTQPARQDNTHKTTHSRNKTKKESPARRNPESTRAHLEISRGKGHGKREIQRSRSFSLERSSTLYRRRRSLCCQLSKNDQLPSNQRTEDEQKLLSAKKTSVCRTTQCQLARMQRSARLARVLSWINSRR